MNAIFKRRSIRKYTDADVSNEQITLLLKAAMAAPSAHNLQPWSFIVVRDKNKMLDITKVHPYSKMLNQAPVAIIVCGNSGNEKNKGFWVQDCSAAIQNILLEATEIGLGSVWLGVYPNMTIVNPIKEIFNIPEGITPLGIVSIGHPVEEFREIDRFNQDLIHYESWNC